MPRIVLDFDPAWTDAPAIEGDTGELVFFLSWAFSARYGASHELAEASMLLRGEFGVDMRPLLKFADREVEMEADAEMLEKAWQDAEPLARACRETVAAIDAGDDRLNMLRNDYPRLRGNIDDLGRIADQAAEHSSRIRVTFELE